MVFVNCPFCTPENEKILFENEHAYAIFDRYPVSHGHILIIPKRHFTSIFDGLYNEIEDIWDLICKGKQFLIEKYSPDGYDIGINDGESAGQTIMHLHIHIIPRYSGDMINPKGGVRGVIPEKQKY